MLFLTSELANEVEITIFSARDTTRAWVPGWGIMGRNEGVYKKVRHEALRNVSQDWLRKLYTNNDNNGP